MNYVDPQAVYLIFNFISTAQLNFHVSQCRHLTVFHRRLAKLIESLKN
jgi:hypothetical protein